METIDFENYIPKNINEYLIHLLLHGDITSYKIGNGKFTFVKKEDHSLFSLLISISNTVTKIDVTKVTKDKTDKIAFDMYENITAFWDPSTKKYTSSFQTKKRTQYQFVEKKWSMEAPSSLTNYTELYSTKYLENEKLLIHHQNGTLDQWFTRTYIEPIMITKNDIEFRNYFPEPLQVEGTLAKDKKFLKTIEHKRERKFLNQ